MTDYNTYIRGKFSWGRRYRRGGGGYLKHVTKEKIEDCPGYGRNARIPISMKTKQIAVIKFIAT